MVDLFLTVGTILLVGFVANIATNLVSHGKSDAVSVPEGNLVPTRNLDYLMACTVVNIFTLLAASCWSPTQLAYLTLPNAFRNILAG